MPTADPELTILQQALAGDRVALSQLLLTHYDALHRHLARSISADLQAVLRPEDVLQQVFIRAAGGIGSFQCHPAGSFGGWLVTIADNLVRDAQKRRRRERRSERPTELPGAASSSLVPLVERLVTDSTTPGERVQRCERARRLRTALTALPDEQREVVERYYLQQQSYEQIAEALGRSKEAVRGLSYRARQNLRDVLGRSSLYFSG